MSKYANLPGYDTSSKTVYGDNIDDNMSMPEEDRDWKAAAEGEGEEENEENVEIITCEAAEAIKRFREGDIDQIGDVTGRQLTESVETARKMMDKLTDTGANTQSLDVEMVAQEASKPDSSYRIYSNAEATISQLQQRISRLEELVNSVPADPLQPGGSLSDIAQTISQKMALLEDDKVKAADARLGSLLEKYKEVPESLQKLPDLHKWEPVFTALPAIVERLESLAPVHQVAARVAQNFVNLEKCQAAIQSQLDRSEATQNELHSAMNQNLKIAAENAKNLTARFEKLQ
ncbi:Oidioi.mRNA.OKI2018_I69.XSR.g16447.t1.cds [Oikopleura dioica]|uniref:Oidioi.mRNA.OKI2018_I69.XSR.g16447.t1.cds n=1 Tax=Oikopleura dioica TaxID=34765 RepID=A0ABN7SK39_OIKDI|nr:Oidioi.mRNA.OKI2018_I69.XSR.g16447.t1.cds [Oikopleura dioica]